MSCPVLCLDAEIATEGQTNVNLGAESGCDTMSVSCAWVTLNGSRLSEGGDYSIAGDRIVFANPLHAGDQVSVRWIS
jgi:acyl dehydratase